MSGGFLDGFLTECGEQSDEAYRQGEASLGDILAVEAAERSLDRTERAAWLAFFRDFVEGHSEDFDANSFIAAYLSALSVHATVPMERHLEAYLSPMIQRMYLLGHNGFHVVMAGWRPEEIAGSLSGESGRPLTLTYAGDAGEFGSKSSHCRLTIKGDADRVGSGGWHCEYHADGEVKEAGRGAWYSTFNLRSARSVYGADFLHINLLKHIPRNCAFYVREPPSDEEIASFPLVGRSLEKNHVFDHGKNALFAPDEEGSWKEVLP